MLRVLHDPLAVILVRSGLLWRVSKLGRSTLLLGGWHATLLLVVGCKLLGGVTKLLLLRHDWLMLLRWLVLIGWMA